jgi:hypothetical protein
VSHDSHCRHSPDRTPLAPGRRARHRHGGLTIALARSFKIIDPELEHPGTAERDRAFALFDLLI